MRAVIDTGVLISAAIKAATFPTLAVYQATRRGVLLKSLATQAELIQVIDRPALARLIAPAARARLLELMMLAELVPVTDTISACRDRKDDKFLDLALNGNADVIVSGDRDLLVLSPFRGIPILPPATFVQGITYP